VDTNTSHRKERIADDWFADAFGDLYPVVYAHRTVDAAAPEAVFAAATTGLAGGHRALDLCCGAGRHLVTLEQYGALLTGADYSPQLLSLARKRLSAATALIRADMRALPLAACFDVVFSFFTSFGYFLNDADNLAAAVNMARILKPAGRFFMDYLNPLSLDRRLEPESRRESQGYIIYERRWIDWRAKRVNKKITVERDGIPLGTTTESVRLYTLEELTALLKDAGLRVEAAWGDYTGSVYEEDAARMILTGAKTT